jgi:hypothetical protein
MQCVLLSDDVDSIVRRSFEAVDALTLRRSARRPCCCATGSLCWTVSGPDVDSKLGGKWQRLARDVSGDRVGNVTRNRLSRVRFTNDRWDKPIDVYDLLDAQLRRRRARQLPRLAARQAVSAVGRAARSIVGCVLGGVTH